MLVTDMLTSSESLHNARTQLVQCHVTSRSNLPSVANACYVRLPARITASHTAAAQLTLPAATAAAASSTSACCSSTTATGR